MKNFSGYIPSAVVIRTNEGSFLLGEYVLLTIRGIAVVGNSAQAELSFKPDLPLEMVVETLSEAVESTVPTRPVLAQPESPEQKSVQEDEGDMVEEEEVAPESLSFLRESLESEVPPDKPEAASGEAVTIEAKRCLSFLPYSVTIREEQNIFSNN